VKVRVGERERDGERERGLKHIYFIIYHMSFQYILKKTNSKNTNK